MGTIKLQDYLVQTLIDTMKYVSDKMKDEMTDIVMVDGKLPFNLSTEGSINLSNATDKIIKERKEECENYTFEDIWERLKNILIEIYHSKPKNQGNLIITKKVKELLSDIKKQPDKYSYLIPTMNIDLIIDHLKIGNVCFLRLTDEKIEELKNDFSTDELFSSKSGEKRGIVVARISNIIASTDNKATEKALSLLEDSINAIRVVNPWSPIGIEGDFSYKQRNFRFITASGKIGSRRKNLWVDWASNPLKIDKGILDRMNQVGGLKYIQKLFSIESPTRFQKSILTSIHWFGEAVKDEKEEDRFVKLVIALESIFITNRGESKAEKISERFAFLVGRNKDERIDFYKRMKKYIGIRNKIVHDGFVGVEHIDLRFLTDCTRSSIIEFCKKNDTYVRLEDFLNELDERKFE